MTIAKCPGCKVDYSDDILSVMFVSSGYTPQICGLCALEVTNAIHGANFSKFRGEIAESNRIEALKHRQKTGQTGKCNIDELLYKE